MSIVKYRSKNKYKKPVIEVFEYTEEILPELGIKLGVPLSDKDWIIILHDKERIWVAESIAYTLDSPNNPYVIDLHDKIVWICGHA